MGLGKTIQTIAFFSYLMHSQSISRPFLVVAPLSTLPNWQRELQKWLPEAYIVCFQGTKIARDVMRSHEFYFGQPIPKSYPKFNVLLTSYEMLQAENKSLSKFNWKVIVVDEGQKLKNQKTKVFNCAVNMKSDFRILLTGTPLQNNIEELLNLLHFISPQKFNENVNEELKKKFYSSIEESNLNQNKSEDSDEAPNSPRSPVSGESNEAVVSLKSLLQPHLLRRLKDDVLDNFPLKREIIIPIDLTERQRKIYK